MSNRTTKKKNSIPQRSSSESILLLFPLLLTVIILPLIVKMHSYHTGLNIYDWYTEADDACDFFLYYKQWFFVGVCGLAVLIVAGRAFFDKKTLKFTKTLLPLMIYAALALLSTIFSKYSGYGIHGIYEQFENIFCILGYALVVYYAFLMIQSEDELKLMIKAVAIGALLIGIIASLQTFGHDFFASDAGKSMIAEPDYDINDLGVAFDNGRAYASLYNPNYLGVYTAFMIPLFTVMFFFSKSISEYLLYGAVVLTSIISLVGSQSKSGIIGLAVSFIFGIIMLRKYVLSKWKIIVPVLAVLIITFIGVNIVNDNAYIKAIKNALHVTTPVNDLSDINTKKDHVEFTFKGNTFNVLMADSETIMVTDQNNTSIPYSYAGTGDTYVMYQLMDERLTNVFVYVYMDPSMLSRNLNFGIFYNGYSFNFSNTFDETQYLYYNRYGRFSPIKSPETAIFTGNENFASGRGFIWSRTIPALKKNLLLGSGADSFIMEFPQYDFLGYLYYGFAPVVISKPHSLYLQVGIQSGVLSLIAMLAFFAIYMVQSIRLYFKNSFDTASAKIGLAVCIAVSSYLVTGISNDSSISVAPVFWSVVGVGFTANYLYKRSLNKQ